MRVEDLRVEDMLARSFAEDMPSEVSGQAWRPVDVAALKRVTGSWLRVEEAADPRPCWAQLSRTRVQARLFVRLHLRCAAVPTQSRGSVGYEHRATAPYREERMEWETCAWKAGEQTGGAAKSNLPAPSVVVEVSTSTEHCLHS